MTLPTDFLFFVGIGLAAQIVDGAHREPTITRLLLDLATGRRTYRDVRRRVLARAPLVAGRFAWELLKSAAL